MTNGVERFEVGIEFDSVLRTFSTQIYDTPYAFIRENLQNAIDACRQQAHRQGIPSSDPSLRIDITVNEKSVQIQDRGIGMSSEDLRNLFWTIGASGKRTEEARAAGCVGMFGIGGFANFGVCETLIVTSQAESSPGQRTELKRSDFTGTVGLPQVEQQPSDLAAPRGTVVEGVLYVPSDVNELHQYVRDIVRFCREPVYFNGALISGDQPTARSISRVWAESQTWTHNGVDVTATLYETETKTLIANLETLTLGGTHSTISGVLHFEGNGIDILRNGFKLCSTTVATRIGVSGFIDCDLLSPTAGRDSLNAESNGLLAKVIAALDRAAVLAVLESSDLIDQHTRIFRYVRSHALVDRIGKVTVQTADGAWLTLDEVRARATNESQVYFATSSNPPLTNTLLTRGHMVVNLPSDNHKSAAIRDYLSSLGATALTGHVECAEEYTDLSRFEKAFLGELAETISYVYQVHEMHLIAGSLTEDIPVFVSNPASRSSTPLRIYIDSRHPEVDKLSQLGMTSLFRSMVSAFCREYLGPTLRSRSPKFFGSGALNMDWLVQNRSEAWVLLTGDIAVVSRATQRQVVTASDVHVVVASPHEQTQNANESDGQPKLVRIVGGEEFNILEGYYLRVPNSASEAYGDVIIDLEELGSVWAGNRILLVASDAISTAFQFQILLDRLLVTTDNGSQSQGAVVLDRPIQQLFEGLYFPIPAELEEHLVPAGDQRIPIEVLCDWLDFAGSRSWEARE